MLNIKSIENNNGIKRSQVLDLFNNCNHECLNIYHAQLVEIKLILKDGTNLNLLYGENIQYIDISDNYLGLGSFIIKPYENIIFMKVEFRGCI